MVDRLRDFVVPYQRALEAETGGRHVHLVWSKNSCGLVRIVFQESPEPFTTLDRTLTRRVLMTDHRKEQHVAFALMIPLVMIMLHILGQGMAERRFPEQDHPRETLLLDRPHPP